MKKYIVLILVFLVFLLRDSWDYLVLYWKEDFKVTSICTIDNKNLEEENEELKGLLNLSMENEDYIPTMVKYRDVLDYLNTIEIYKGSEEGISKGMVVFNDEGLIGIVKVVNKHSSVVRLITSKDSNVSVRIGAYYGILQVEDGQLVVNNLTNYDQVSIGDKIYTSGLTDVVGNILIGEVVDVYLDDLEIAKKVVVDASVDFNNITYCMVGG